MAVVDKERCWQNSVDPNRGSKNFKGAVQGGSRRPIELPTRTICLQMALWHIGFLFAMTKFLYESQATRRLFLQGVVW
jgi:hypothetical protein